MSLLQRMGLSIILSSPNDSYPGTVCHISFRDESVPFLEVHSHPITRRIHYPTADLILKFRCSQITSDQIDVLRDISIPTPSAYVQAWATRIRQDRSSLTSATDKSISATDLHTLISKVFHLHNCLGSLHFTTIATDIRDNFFTNTNFTYREVMLVGKYADCAACAAA